ncbi:MAG: transaldolase, partial [Campylobacteraceae bacterium]|nr:transaldolase [Campylobacteraceae bacterium]
MSLYPNNFSLWCDFIERDFLENDFKKFLESEVIVGITSNPVIFKNAIKSSKSYEGDKKDTINLDAQDRYELMAIK